jgi:hypothetical protein
VRLAGTLAETFDGPTLDSSRWLWGNWSGGSYTPAPNGTLAVDASGGAWVRSQNTFASAAVEGTLTFGAAQFQHFGFASDGFESNRYAIFSTAGTTNHLFARLNNNTSEQSVDLGAIPVGAHHYRVVWTPQGASDLVQYYLDDAQVASLSMTPLPPLYIYLSNATAGTPLVADMVQTMPPFVGSGTFIGCAFDAGANVNWQTLSWVTSMPNGTTLDIESRTSFNGSSWSAWSSVPPSTGVISSPAGRYLQYRATFTTTDPQVSAELDSITAVHGLQTVPTPINTPTNTPTDMPTNTPTNTPTGTATDTPTNTPVPPTNTPTNTPTPADGSIVQNSVVDFGAVCASPSSVAVTEFGDGEVRLAGSFGDTFDGPTLDSTRWLWGTWNGGSYMPSPTGTLQISGPNGAWLRSQTTSTHQTIEGVMSFGAAPWQHFGFASDGFQTDQYLILSTAGTPDHLYARSNNNGAEQRTDLGAIPTGMHYYRIEWAAQDATTDIISYFIDGILVAQHTVATEPALFTYLSHNAQGSSPPLVVDQVNQLPPYVASGSYISCALDAGRQATWNSLSWNANLPAGTTLTVSARSSADGTAWTGWSEVATSGAPPSVPVGRYLQYRLVLTTNDTQLSPVVNQVTAQYQ